MVDEDDGSLAELLHAFYPKHYLEILSTLVNNPKHFTDGQLMKYSHLIEAYTSQTIKKDIASLSRLYPATVK